jgi:NAD(P)-dependent dehydrogenase (short-subunit alcohol dehydrogenase family)
MSGNLENRVAIVTGGARGIGFAVAQTLAMEGAQVVIADNGCALDGGPEDSVVTDAAVARLESRAPGCAAGFDENLALPGAAERCVAFAAERFGNVDLLINNAAVHVTSPIHRLDLEEFERVLRNNLIVPAAMMAAATPRMREQASAGRIPGAVVNLVSAAGFIGNPNESAQAASKGGLIALTRSAAMDLSAVGITCNAVSPWASTRLTQSMRPVGDSQAEYKDRALKVPIMPVANLVAFLCTSYAARITGQLLGVRGREVLLFHPAAPSMTVFTDSLIFDAEQYAQYMRSVRGKLADLRNEYEIFNVDPIL